MSKAHQNNIGSKIIDLLSQIIQIYDSEGKKGLEAFMAKNSITLHQDSTNVSSIESNVENIRTIIDLFNNKYADNIEQGYTEFNKYIAGDPTCIDAKVSVLTDFLMIDNPFKSSKNKDSVIGLKMLNVIKELCSSSLNRFIEWFRNKNNIDEVKKGLKHEFRMYLDTDITSKEIDAFVDAYIGDHMDDEEPTILSCDGKLKALREGSKIGAITGDDDKDNLRRYNSPLLWSFLYISGEKIFVIPSKKLNKTNDESDVIETLVKEFANKIILIARLKDIIEQYYNKCLAILKRNDKTIYKKLEYSDSDVIRILCDKIKQIKLT